MLLLGAVAGQAMAAGSISGKVSVPATRAVVPLDADGNPVSDSAVHVNAANDKFQDFRTMANADGTYKLEGLEPGAYTVVVVGAGMDPVVQKDVVVTDNQDKKLDVTLAEAQPLKIPKTPGGNAIPLDRDINSADFANAPEIQFTEPWQLQPQGLSGTGTLLNWKPSDVSGRIRLMYSNVALHLAADINFKTPGVNNWPDNGGREIWDGNHMDIFFQNDAYDPKRTAYDKDHDWQALVKLAEPEAFSIRQFGVEPEGQNPPQENSHIKDYVRRVVKTTGDGELDRVDFPWAIFRQYGEKTGAIAAPADNSFAALDIGIGGADPDQAKDEAQIKTRLSWSGFFEGWQHPNLLRPVQFTPQ